MPVNKSRLTAHLTLASVGILLAVGVLWSRLACGAEVPSFAATRLLPAGSTPYGVTVGDFNQDGKADVAVANFSSSSTVSVLLGNGDGTFQRALTNTAGSFLQAVTSADVNHDGKPDLIASGLLGVSLLLGNGDGTFQPATTLTGPSTPALAFGDFNGDNSPDVAYASGSIYLTIGLGNGNGTFQTGGSYLISKTAGPDFVAVKDMNHDGINDLVVACDGAAGVVSVLLGNGDGTFKNPVNTSVGTYDYALAAADFNGDGTNDVAVTDYNAGTVSILRGNGDGTLTFMAAYNVGAQAQSVATGDFNGDSRSDLIVAAGTNTTVLLGNGDGTFQPPVQYEWLRLDAKTGDFNGDGKTDFAACALNNPTSIGVVLGNGDGTFQAAPHYPVELGPNFIASGDLNGDGKAELVVANANSNNISVLLNQGNGAFLAHTNYPTGANPQSVVVADFSGLGTNDVVVANLNSGTVSLLRGKGDGTLQAATAAGSVTIGSSYVLAGDFNRDQKQDLAVVGLFGALVFRGNGNDTFQSSVTTTGPALLDPLAAGDWNGDGKLDLAYGNYGANTVAIMLGNGSGSFTAPTNRFAGTNVQSVAVGDFNGDGTNDLAVGCFGSGYPANGTVSVLLGRGDGTFQAPTNWLAGGSFKSVAVADFNADGLADLAAADISANQVDVRLGNGDGTFQPAYVFAVGNGVSFITAGDLNGDGRPDLAVANAAANSVSVLLNTFVAAGPVLTLAPVIAGAKTLSFSWPASAAGYTLESITNLATANWQTSVTTRVTNDGLIQVSIPVGNGAQFFRLSK